MELNCKHQLVSVNQLKPYREFDRSIFSKSLRYGNLKRSIQKYGIKEPIWIFIHSNGKIHIAEGNFRLAIAEELGIKNIPVRVAYYDREDIHNTHKFPPKEINRKIIGLITKPSSLGFTKEV